MRPLLALLLALWLAAGPAGAQAVEFSPGGIGFRVMFPGPYRVKMEQVNTRFGNTYGLMATLERGDGASFYAQITDYPQAALQEGPQRILETLKFGRTVKGVVRAEQRFQFEGNPAQRLVVDLNVVGRPVIASLDVLRGLRLYSIFCIVDRSREEAGEVRSFIDSFALLPL